MNANPTLAQKIFACFMTASMVLSMCPLNAIARALIEPDGVEPLTVDDVTIVDGEAILSDGDGVAALAEESEADPEAEVPEGDQPSGEDTSFPR